MLDRLYRTSNCQLRAIDTQHTVTAACGTKSRERGARSRYTHEGIEPRAGSGSGTGVYSVRLLRRSVRGPGPDLTYDILYALEANQTKLARAHSSHHPRPMSEPTCTVSYSYLFLLLL